MKKKTLVIDGVMSQEGFPSTNRELDFEEKKNLSSFEKGQKIKRHF